MIRKLSPAGAVVDMVATRSITQASPTNRQIGTLSPVILPIGPAPGRPESGGGTKWAGASNCVPVCSSITTTSRLYAPGPIVRVGAS